MFGHLDDPAAGEPTARQIAAVYARSSAVRRRRANLRFTVIGALLLVLGAVSGVVVAHQPAQLAASNLALQDNQLLPGLAVSSARLIGAVFPDSEHGFAMTEGTHKVALVATNDAGSSWTVVDSKLPIASPWGAQLDFSSPTHGFLWEEQSSVSAVQPLWVTSDGGRTWARAPIGPVVSDVSAIGNDVWAVVNQCIGNPEPASTVGCSTTLERSSDGGTTWSSAAPIPTIPSGTETKQSVELARMTSAHAYVLTFDPSFKVGGALEQISYTSDAGATWTTRPDPCQGSLFFYASELAGAGTNDLWLFCAGEPSAGLQPKALYRSYDGGITWNLVSSAIEGVTGSPIAGLGNLPESGYFGEPTLGHQNIAVLSPSTAWLFLDRSQVIETTDGGHTWRNASLPGFSPDGYGSVVFADARHGWVDYPSYGIWETTNATTWKQLG